MANNNNKWVTITVDSKTGEVKIEPEPRACCTQAFIGFRSGGDLQYGYYCPEEEQDEYVIKTLEYGISDIQQVISEAQKTIAKAQKSIALFEKKINEYRT